MERFLLKDVLGMYTALHGGIICVLQTKFSSFFFPALNCRDNWGGRF